MNPELGNALQGLVGGRLEALSMYLFMHLFYISISAISACIRDMFRARLSAALRRRCRFCARVNAEARLRLPNKPAYTYRKLLNF